MTQNNAPPINLLAVSVGNTHTRLGSFQEGELVDTRAYRNEELGLVVDEAEQAFGAIRSRERATVLLSSVCPDITDRLRSDLQKRLGVGVGRVDEDLMIPIGRQLDPEAIIGEDRLLNAAAAYDTLRQACVIIDAGTAMTVDFLDGAGTVHGGAIVPGAQMMLESLQQRTEQLPEVEMDRPEEPVGHNTVEAMRSGVYHALQGASRELTERYAEMAGAYPCVVATGGNADLLFRGYELVERIVPELTLHGMAVTLRTALQQPDSS